MTTPAAMTYDSLFKDVEEYSERHDQPFISHIPRFIMLAENRIASEVRGLGFLKIVEGRLQGSVLAKPVRWRETANMHAMIDGRMQYLKERSYEYCRMYAPDATRTGTPKFYSDYGYEHWFIVPAPTEQLNLEISYYERPEPLGPSVQTNWTTQYAPQLLLYGALLEAQPFLKLDGRLETYKGLYGNAAEAVTNEAKRRAFDRSYGIRE